MADKLKRDKLGLMIEAGVDFQSMSVKRLAEMCNMKPKAVKMRLRYWKIPFRGSDKKNQFRPWSLMNWNLPSRDLEAIWGLPDGLATIRRSTHKMHKPLYDLRYRYHGFFDISSYETEYFAEKEKAARYSKGLLKETS